MYSSVRQVHIEVTTRCNARCPQCPRNIDGGAQNPALPLAELNAKDIEKIFADSVLDTVRTVNICGNYGDPAVATELLEVCEILKARLPGLDIHVHSNGGARSPQWWQRLASLANRCTFAIDGLEDTNHVYRRNVGWDRLMKNCEAYIRGGGSATWCFIVFAHNEHQVDTAREFSRRMGFARFLMKSTGRFLSSYQLLESSPVRDEKGSLLYQLRAPSLPKYRNRDSLTLSRLCSNELDYIEYLQSTTVSCKAVRDRELYISAEGLVLPCCWLGQLYPPNGPTPRKTQVNRLLAQLPGGLTDISALHQPISKILRGDLFQTTIPLGWNVGEGRTLACGKFCGEYRPSQRQVSQLIGKL